MRVKIYVLSFVLGWILLSFSSSFGIESASGTGPSAFFREDRYAFEPVLEGSEVKHDFIVENRGSADLVIDKVQSG